MEERFGKSRCGERSQKTGEMLKQDSQEFAFPATEVNKDRVAA